MINQWMSIIAAALIALIAITSARPNTLAVRQQRLLDCFVNTRCFGPMQTIHAASAAKCAYICANDTQYNCQAATFKLASPNATNQKNSCHLFSHGYRCEHGHNGFTSCGRISVGASSVTSSPIEWTEGSNGKSYYVQATPAQVDRVSWGDARQWCRQHGGDLASVHSAAEHQFIYSLAASKLSSFLYVHNGGWMSVWLGGTNENSTQCETADDTSSELSSLELSPESVRPNTCQYNWSDGTRWTYTAWAEDEPNHVVWYGSQREQCLGMIMTQGATARWNDYVCAPNGWNNIIGFVCQATLL
jgi:hypothetical protein